MIPLHRDSHFTFRFGDDRTIPRFHLEGIAVGRHIAIYQLDWHRGVPLDLIRTAIVGEGGWVDVTPPIFVRAEEGFVVVPEEDHS